MATIESVVPMLDLGGTFVFAISGAVAAVNRRLDIFGILVLSFVTGNLGGITRDLLIGAVPPAALIEGRYLLISVLAGLITFFWYAGVNRLRTPVLLFDAAGLSFFAVAGTQKALEFGLSPVASALLGMLTSIGGGMMRDVLLSEIPQVLRSDLYAIAALAGALIVVIGNVLGLSYGWCLCAGWRSFVPRSSLHGDQTRLAFACRASLRARTRGNRSIERQKQDQGRKLNELPSSTRHKSLTRNDNLEVSDLWFTGYNATFSQLECPCAESLVGLVNTVSGRFGATAVTMVFRAKVARSASRVRKL